MEEGITRHPHRKWHVAKRRHCTPRPQETRHGDRIKVDQHLVPIHRDQHVASRVHRELEVRRQTRAR